MASLLCLILLTIVISNVVNVANAYGKQACLDQYGYALALYENGRFICSAALMNPNWGITAGHCLAGKTAANLKVVAGVVRLTRTAATTWHEVQSYRTYDSFGLVGPDVYRHDLGIFKLKVPLDLSVRTNIRKIPLTLDSGDSRRTGCKLVLFRDVYNRATSVHQMDLSQRWSTVTITTRRECLNINTLLDNEMCALNESAAGSLESGDSGAPIVCNGKLFGILVSEIFKNGRTGNGATILQVTPYMNWMADIVDPPK